MDEALVIRDARPSDAVGIAKVHVATWQSTYPGLVPDTYLVNLSEAAAAMRWHNAVQAHGPGQGALVVVDGMDSVVGFATYGGRRIPVEGYEGEFYALYLLDEAQGQGLGRRLMATMAERLQEGGKRTAVVWCLRDNPARWFYERLGGVRVAERPIRFAGAELVEIAYGWRDLAPLARLSAGPEMR
ncbi:GNAT family acetyltransferase (plasmid) [Azospirillum argentinense]|uniref:GNAT family N-acetyltransferase n=1 Tax=Azospirillum argentinense TaxID=2970906 RepID=A0A5B0KMR7_9PROT|nr:GNAT family N-acetyltransferase [Azospirillum argentinense]AIB13981.1 GNAT family acetyltransferase [Azospirillum argentinense]EZQ05751.1 GNAT family acetyltransferase [Azospirillum argentinense]KAA1053113.1 Acetyltransferase, GNAT family [Azospirillum argentinense]PNQ96234.1 GNAT family N-acetyltransferase [Azospirillum argentinense]